jgi:hypothetical protein
MNELLLERYNLGELTPEEKTEVEAALAADPSLAKRIAEIRRSDAEIRAAMPAALILRAIGKKAGSRDGRARGRGPAVWGLAAAALLVAVILPAFLSVRRDADEDRAKGSTELSVYLKTASGEAMLQTDTLVRGGDTVQLAYMTAESRYGVIFSVDGRSSVTLLYPDDEKEESAPLVSGRRTALADAYILDDAPDCEIFFFVTSDKPVDTREILTLARQIAKDPKTAVRNGESVFKNYELRTLTLRKE